MHNYSKNLQLFKNYIATKDHNLLKEDTIADYFDDKTKIKKALKNFWKTKKSPFYKEAYFYSVYSSFILIAWIILSLIGFSLIAYNPNNVVFLSIGIVFVLLALINNWVFIIFNLKNKPSYYYVVLNDTKIKTNYNTMLWFYAFGFTSLIGKAIMSAIQSEMILLLEIESGMPIDLDHKKNQENLAIITNYPKFKKDN
ncbi:hypothetical protein MCAV_05590 [[Mycoplasma] cavipharyngis]|uniref:hypothetical protein n=1 Tax=[Mycoplasma] cavipharyngis TaxID=92757 RepID=UPI0037048CBE